MIRYIMNKNALKDFTPFCDENYKNRTQAMVNENEHSMYNLHNI